MNPCFVVGNGESRKGIDLSQIREFGHVVGCNALYRDFKPDMLVSVNPSMTAEILGSDYDRAHVFTNNGSVIYQNKGQLGPVKVMKDPGWSSGPLALLIAVEKLTGCDSFFMLGFDLYSDDGKVNNVYKGSPNYLSAGSNAVHCGNWIEHIASAMRDHPDKKYYRVGRESDELPESWGQVIRVSYDQTMAMLKKNRG